ncbi:MAG: hypothetical protein WA063_00550 [Minisyncoccia bacterium]
MDIAEVSKYMADVTKDAVKTKEKTDKNITNARSILRVIAENLVKSNMEHEKGVIFDCKSGTLIVTQEIGRDVYYSFAEAGKDEFRADDIDALSAEKVLIISEEAFRSDVKPKIVR